jgi:DNA polymerase-3 subunit beta
VPAAAAGIILSIASSKDAQKDVTLYIDKGQISTVFDNVNVVSLLIDGDYPNYKSIIPAESKTKVTVATADLQNEVKRSMIFDSISNNSVEIDYNDKELVISSKSSEKGNIVGRLMATGSGEAVKVTCNAQFLLDALNKIKDAEVTIEFNSAHGPLLIHKKEGEGRVIFLVMPLRTN